MHYEMHAFEVQSAVSSGRTKALYGNVLCTITYAIPFFLLLKILSNLDIKFSIFCEATVLNMILGILLALLYLIK
jgi:hypothetical protein